MKPWKYRFAEKAFDAYYNSLGHIGMPGTFPHMPAAEQEAWYDVAEAVIDSFLNGVSEGDDSDLAAAADDFIEARIEGKI